MMLGIGLYAPCMIMIALLGMDPKAAFPIPIRRSATSYKPGNGRSCVRFTAPSIRKAGSGNTGGPMFP